MRRREFIYRGLLATFALTHFKGCRKQRFEYKHFHSSDDVEPHLYYGDLAFRHLTKVPLPRDFQCHSIEWLAKDDLALTEKWRSRLVFMNYKDQRFHKVLTLDEGKQFVGHSVFVNEMIFVSVSDYSKTKGEGYVYVYDYPTFNLVKKIKTQGKEPHEIFVLSDKVCVLNAGLAEDGEIVDHCSVSIINPKSLKVERRLPIKRGLHFAHGAKIDEERIFVIGFQLRDKNLHSSAEMNSRPYGGIINLKDGSLRELDTKTDYYSSEQLLSAVYSKKMGMLIASCPLQGKVYTWDLYSGQLLYAVRFKKAASLALNESEDMVYISGRLGRVITLSLKDFNAKRSTDFLTRNMSPH